MHLKHGRYYLVRRNKWEPLSRDLRDALVEYARLTSGPEAGALGELMRRTLADLKLEVAESTINNYQYAATRILKAFAKFTPQQIKPHHIALFLDHHKATPVAANTARSLLSGMFKRAVRWGIVETNPVRDIEQFKTKKRDRYITDAEFSAIREQAPPTLQCMMDLAYIIGQRISDLIKIRYTDITDAGIYVKQKKTGARIMMAMTPDLSAVISRARGIHQSVKGMTLFHRRDGRLCSYYTLHDQWVSACKMAGVEDAHFHDIRACTATDAEEMGRTDGKTLLGHTTEGSHQRYLRGKIDKIAQPMPARKS